MYEEILFVLKGRGAADIWTPKTENQTFEWQEGSLFTIPLNVSHQLYNGDGRQPALILGCSFAPTMINLMHSDDFIFNNDFVFKDRYAGQPDYFRGEGKVIGKKMLETNLSPTCARSRSSTMIQVVGADARATRNGGQHHVAAYAEFPREPIRRPTATNPERIFNHIGQGATLEWPQGKEPRNSIGGGKFFMPPSMVHHIQYRPVPARYIAFNRRPNFAPGQFMNMLVSRTAVNKSSSKVGPGDRTVESKMCETHSRLWQR